jgi:hypothetical protein
MYGENDANGNPGGSPVAVAALGIAGSAAVSAAPVYGTSMGAAATTLDLAQNVRWWHRRIFVRRG